MDDENSFRQALLSSSSSSNGDDEQHERFHLLKCSVRFGLMFVMWTIFLTWVAIIILYPTTFMTDWLEDWYEFAEGTIYDTRGAMYVVFTLPVLAIAMLACAYVALSPTEPLQKKKGNSLLSRLWTCPFLVHGPFGVVSGAELIGIALVYGFVIWTVTSYTIQQLQYVCDPETTELCFSIFERLGGDLGQIGLFCVGLLFLPVSRGSILLRLVGIPFEHAIRYHIWLGHLTMVIFTVHGILNITYWTMEGTLTTELVHWRDEGISDNPGVIAYLAGLLMWVTSLYPLRKKWFELFFYTHQLYVVFVVFMALHATDYYLYLCGGGIFLFMLDRFLRFCQSRTIVDILSVKCLPSGTIDLALAKPPSIRYNALSFIFLQVREVSLLQWHPFSVSSCPLDGRLHLSLLIKTVGGWTEALRDHILKLNERHSHERASTMHEKPFQITASVEGPYGYESPYYLQYEYLVLIAGGSGISPFIAILRDILHRLRERKRCLAKNILLLWCVKKSNEISLLSKVGVSLICPSFQKLLNLNIQVYVTKESEPTPMSLENGHVENETVLYFPEAGSNRISGLVGTGSAVWSGFYIFSSSIGFVIIMGLVKLYLIGPFDITAWWFTGILSLMSMVTSVLVFGGLVIVFWHLSEKRNENKNCGLYGSPGLKVMPPINNNNTYSAGLTDVQQTFYGHRPDFKVVFDSISDKWGDKEVGVIVCGPPSLETTIAAECRDRSFTKRKNQPVFHFHSHSFDI